MQNMVIFALLIFGLAIAIIKRPPVALAGIFCLFGLKQWAQGTMIFFVQNGTIPNYCVGLLLLLGLTVKFIRGERVFSPYPGVGLLCLLLFAFAALSVQWAPNTDKSTGILMRELPYIITIVLLAPLLINSPKDVRDASLGTMVLGGTLALLLLFQVSWFNRMIVLAGGHWGDEGANPLAVAQMGGYIVLSAMLLQFRNLRFMGWLIRILLAGLGLILIVKSGSRGQFLSLLVILVLFVPMRQRMDNPMKFIAFIVSMSVVAGLATWLQGSFTTEAALDRRWTSGKMLMDVSARLQNVQTLLGIWSTSPLGVLLFGLGNSASFSLRQLGFYPHFVPGEVLAEEGLLGASLYLSILLVCFKSIPRAFSRIRGIPDSRSALAVLGAIFVYEFLLTLKQGSLIGNTSFFGVAIMLGRLYLAFMTEDTVKPAETNSPSWGQTETRF